ncbi:hypothetical protein DTO013E5_5810 [Penicillium roqueforti]|nr:hypothetical protein DTO012A1_7451 [Penicillium roqueforti]KAI2738414.1 hypothetical protein DTO013F2_9621 [Penicillium roqueforti]KAI2772574.1 hypothetical protein DTO012A8_2925 [Penicillium roqueforti]KAI3208208.1 hypothetical protein DTO013E5_5810 [Penicillium roqueforti]KAI3226226.1 hypothetical protein DTO012A9_9387 [Penicillium roqueforti]
MIREGLLRPTNSLRYPFLRTLPVAQPYHYNFPLFPHQRALASEMLQIRFTLNNTGDAEQNSLNNLPSLSADEILRSLCHCCKIQSSLSRDEIAVLYERARMSTDCLIDYDIVDYCQVQSPATCTSAFGNVAHARSPEPVCIDPSLTTMDMNVRDHNMTAFVSTPDPSRFGTPTLSNAEAMLSQPASPPHEIAHNPHAKPSPVTPHDGCPSNEFDWALRECDNSNAPEPSPSSTPRSCDPTKESASFISRLTGGSEDQWTPGMDIDEDSPVASLPTSPTPVSGRLVWIGERSPETSPHNVSAGIMQEGGFNEMEISAVEEAQQNVTGNHSGENRPALGTSSPSLRSGAGLSFPTPTSNPPDTPVSRSKYVERSAGRTTSGIDSENRAVDKHQSTPTFSKLQPTVEDASDDTENDHPQTASTNDEDFGDSEIESVLDEMPRFLQDTSCSIENSPPGDNNSVNTESNPITFTPVSISPTFNRSDRHNLPNEEQHTDSRQVTSECENRQILQTKRKLFPGLESHSAPNSRNLRPRLEKGKSGIQAPHYDEIAENVGENSSSGRILARSVVKGRVDSSVGPTKTTVPSKPGKDKWNGRFLCDPLLSTLSPEKKDEVERKCDRILRPDMPYFMEKHTKSWKLTGFWHSPQLDVAKYPLVSSSTKGFAIWRYVDAMQAGEETHYLKSRLADIMLYLAYVEELHRQKEAGHPGQTAKVKATDIICGTASLSKAIAERTRKSFHEHKLVDKTKLFLWTLLFLDRLLTGGEFTEQLTKKEVQLWIREAKAVSWNKKYTACWKPWSTNAVASMASEFLLVRSSGSERPRQL